MLSTNKIHKTYLHISHFWLGAWYVWRRFKCTNASVSSDRYFLGLQFFVEQYYLHICNSKGKEGRKHYFEFNIFFLPPMFPKFHPKGAEDRKVMWSFWWDMYNVIVFAYNILLGLNTASPRLSGWLDPEKTSR